MLIIPSFFEELMEVVGPGSAGLSRLSGKRVCCAYSAQDTLHHLGAHLLHFALCRGHVAYA